MYLNESLLISTEYCFRKSIAKPQQQRIAMKRSVEVGEYNGAKAKSGQRFTVHGETDLEAKTTCSRDREVSVTFQKWPLRGVKEDGDRVRQS